MLLNPPPGAYDTITSDFELQKLQILRQKRISQPSTSVGFSASVKRFSDEKPDLSHDIPLIPKLGIGDNLPKLNPRGGAFGSKTKVSLYYNILYICIFI